MDWIKSKNILILALIFTNLALFILSGGLEKIVVRDQLEDPLAESVSTLLAQRGIKINAVLPANEETIHAIDLEYDVVDVKALADKLFDKKYNEEQGLYLGEKGDLLVVALERELRYEWPKARWPKNEPLEEDKAWQIGEAFLKKIGFDHEDRMVWSYMAESDHVILEWHQHFGTYFLEEAFMRVRLSGDQVVSFERRWFDPPIPQEAVYKVISAPKALFHAAEQIAELKVQTPVDIDSLSLGYTLETGSLVTGITSGEASPYWRMRLSDGTTLFIEAVE